VDFEFRISNFEFPNHPPGESGTSFLAPKRRLQDHELTSRGVSSSEEWACENSKFEIRNSKSDLEP
jgi:hypothetical protein